MLTLPRLEMTRVACPACYCALQPPIAIPLPLDLGVYSYMFARVVVVFILRQEAVFCACRLFCLLMVIAQPQVCRISCVSHCLCLGVAMVYVV